MIVIISRMWTPWIPLSLSSTGLGTDEVIMPIRRDEMLAQLPPVWPVTLLPLIQKHVHGGAKVVVLDDDPTGTQTVHVLLDQGQERMNCAAPKPWCICSPTRAALRPLRRGP
jgi:hypothetical protein